MYKQESIKPYDGEENKSVLVEAMFNNIASTYDKLNHLLSWNIDKYWRKKAIKLLYPFRPKSILDVATGTGDFAIQAAIRLRPKNLVGVDISEKMMSIAQKKVQKKNLSDIISFKKEDCLHLSFKSNYFDAITVAFGIRNFQDLDKGLSEMCRVLKENGHLCILELTMPIKFPIKQLFHIYAHTILPFYGKLISKDQSAYKYLTATIEAFPQGEEMVKILHHAGFSKAKFSRLSFGICTLYFAEK